MKNGTERYLDTIKWLGKLYNYFNDQFFNGELVRPVITVQTDERNRAYGWFTLRKVWKENVDDGEYEINMSAQYLNRSAYEIAGTLLHEICHHYAKVNNMQDCSRSGLYHNKVFKKVAENHGLTVVNERGIGWARTSLTDDTKSLVDVFLELYPMNLIYRDAPSKGCRVKTSSTRKYLCPCCGNSVRATKEVNIMCADCNEFMRVES